MTRQQQRCGGNHDGERASSDSPPTVFHLRNYRRLAILGGRPAFAEKLCVGRPNIPDRAALVRRLGAILDAKWLTNDGPMLREFEERIAELVGAPHAIAVSNATLGLQLCARALELRGEIIMPALTFVASAHAFEWEGARPVFCDVDPESLTLDADHVAALVSPRTVGILGVHLWGRLCDTERLGSIAARHGVPLLFDAAHALACERDGRRAGSHGTAEVFSFHATKFVNCFEGGAITTADAALAQRLRLMRNFGFSGVDCVDSLGINAKMSEFAAAAGLTCLDHLDAIVATNRANYQTYQEALEGVPGVALRSKGDAERSNYQYVIVEVDRDRLGLTRDELVVVLWSENVIARRYFWPGCHRVPPYCDRAHAALPVTDSICDRVLALPTGLNVSREDIQTIASVVQSAARSSAEIVRTIRHDATVPMAG